MENVVMVMRGMGSKINDRFEQRLYTPYSPAADMDLHLDFIDTMPDDMRIYTRISFVRVEIVD